MPWIYSTTTDPEGYNTSGVGGSNQYAAKINIPIACAITRLYSVWAGYNTGSVNGRNVLWNFSTGAIVLQSQTYESPDGDESTWYTHETIFGYTTAVVVSSGYYFVGFYRDPFESSVSPTDEEDGEYTYYLTNTSGFPNCAVMVGYNTETGGELYAGVFYITAPDAPTGQSVTRISDNSHRVDWTRNAAIDADQPYSKQFVERWDNVSNTWYLKYTLIGEYSTSDSHSYTDTSTVANRQYRYRVRSWNAAGYSSYVYTDYINTTPATPTNFSAVRVGSNVSLTWTDASYVEDQFKIQSRESTDGGDTWGSWGDVDTPTADSVSYTDTSPYSYAQYRIRAEETDQSLYSSYVESEEVLEPAAPDAPTGLTPDGTAFDATGGKLFRWVHNPTDNTDQTKFSLRIKKKDGTYPKEITNFTDYTLWTAYQSTVENSTDHDIGLVNVTKMYDSDDTGSEVSMYQTVSTMDLTEFDDASASGTDDLIVFTCYISDVSKFTDLRIVLGDDNSNHYYTSVNPSTTLSNGYNRIIVAKTDFSTTGTPTGWNDITYIRIQTTTTASASSAYIESIYLMLADVTDFEDYTGIGYVQFNEITNTNEYFSMWTNNLVNGYDYEWQVKTWGNYATGSAWSNTADVETVSKPIATITDPTAISNYEYSELTVSWNYTQSQSYNQIQYLAKLYDSNDLLLETQQVSSIIATGDSDSCTFDYTLSNESTYTVTLQVQESNNIWSTETSVEFTTDFLVPTKPTISLGTIDPDTGSIDITITNPDVVTEYEEDIVQDSYIDNDNSSTNYDATGELALENDTAGGTTIKTILLDFDLSFFVGKTIVDAQLLLYRKTALTPGIDSTVNYIKSAWDETTVTYATIPTLDTTDYDDHTHSSGDSETWDITTLLEDIADETITDYEGMAVVATTTDGSTDIFYDGTITDSEPIVFVEIEPLNAETDHNVLYRSIDGGSWEIVQDDISKNTTVTDYIPSIGGNNNYYVDAVSALPSSNSSDESDVDVLLTGMFFVNGGNGFEDVVKLVGDISISENINRDETIKKYAGRAYPVKYQGNQKIQQLSFSADCPVTKYDDLVEILESVGNTFYRDWRGRWFYALYSGSKFDKKDPQAYQFNTNITRVEI